MIVLDVSFVMKLLKKEISFNIFSEDDKFIAPYLFNYEIANVLWKLAKFQGLIPTDVRNLIKAVNSLGIEKEQLDIWKLFDCAKETGLTAYDVQKIKEIGQMGMDNNETMTKISIQAALSLYLDFINLFLYLLRFFGRSKN